MFKIATWNVNSLRVRLVHVLEWLKKHNPDVLALQEIKLLEDQFPLEEIKNAGYSVVLKGQKSYNGVAILTRDEGRDVITSLDTFEDDAARVIALTLPQNIRILNVYVPNGQSVESPKYQYKLSWLQHMRDFIRTELEQHQNFIILGDFNIAPDPQDVHDPAFWEGKVLFTEPEKAFLREIQTMGLNDCFRLHPQEEKSYSWWDYRMNSFKRNLGVRIDHIFASSSLSQNCVRCYIDKEPRSLERPSDHAVVLAEFNPI